MENFVGRESNPRTFVLNCQPSPYCTTWTDNWSKHFTQITWMAITIGLPCVDSLTEYTASNENALNVGNCWFLLVYSLMMTRERSKALRNSGGFFNILYRNIKIYNINFSYHSKFITSYNFIWVNSWRNRHRFRYQPQSF